MKNEYYKQCCLKKDKTIIFSWILEKNAKEGNWCTIEEFPGIWFIEKVFSPQIEESLILKYKGLNIYEDIIDVFLKKE